MNTSIAAASLLGFGTQPASTSFQEFGVTLNKIYETQQRQLKEETTSRKSVTDEINKERRAKKKSESDLVSMIRGLNKDEGRSKSGAKKQKGSLLSKALLGVGVVLGGKILYDTVSDRVNDGLKQTIDDMVKSIGDTIDTLTSPLRGLVEGVGGGEEESNNTSQSQQQDSRSSGSGNSGRAPATFNLIGRGEGGYNSVNRGTAGDTPGGAKSVVGKNLTDMTIGELVQAQQSGELFAVGKYQIIPKTMPGFLSTMGIKNNDKFDQATQEKFPQYVLDHKRPVVGAYLSGKSNNRKEAIQALSREFAAVGLAYPEAGRRRGQSRYAGRSGNKASITPEEMGKALDRDRQKLRKGGKVKKKRKGNGPKSEDTIDQIKPLKKQKGGKIFLHWAASGYSGASPNYHATIQGDGKVAKTRDYNTFGGGHTYRQNSEGIGISLAAMAGATTNNFGQYPVKKIQYENMAKLCAQILTSWGHGPSYVTDKTVPTHAEAGRDLPGDNYGPVAWGGDGSRWDLWKLYQNDANGSGGPKIRNMIKGYMSGGNYEVESEDSSNFVTDPGNLTDVTPQAMGAGNISASSPALPPMPTTFDGIIDRIATQALAPIFGALGSMFGSSPSGGQNQQPAEGGEGSTPYSGDVSPQAKTMHDYIVQKGYTSDQAKGLVANIQRESSFDVDAVGDSGSSFGLFQWHADRATRMKAAVSNWASNWQGQIDYALQEHVGPQYQSATAGMSAQDAGYWWMNKWEIPADRARGGPNHMKMNGFIDAYKFQRGGMVGQQINTGRMSGAQNAHMSKLREAQQRMKRKGPRVVQVTLPPIPSQQPSMVESGADINFTYGMKMSQLADFNRRLSMGALT